MSTSGVAGEGRVGGGVHVAGEMVTSTLHELEATSESVLNANSAGNSAGIPTVCICVKNVCDT